MNGKRRLLGSFNHGSMANTLAQSIGVKVTFPQRQVVDLFRDGGFTMLMGDLITLSQKNLPFKVVIFNNGAQDFVELEMKSVGFLNYGTDLKHPNFAAMANAIGIYAKRVSNPADLKGAFEDVFSHPGPALLDVVTNRFELAIPPEINASKVKGFSLYVLKSLIDGCGEDILAVTTTNLWR